MLATTKLNQRSLTGRAVSCVQQATTLTTGGTTRNSPRLGTNKEESELVRIMSQ